MPKERKLALLTGTSLAFSLALLGARTAFAQGNGGDITCTADNKGVVTCKAPDGLKQLDPAAARDALASHLPEGYSLATPDKCATQLKGNRTSNGYSASEKIVLLYSCQTTQDQSSQAKPPADSPASLPPAQTETHTSPLSGVMSDIHNFLLNTENQVKAAVAKAKEYGQLAFLWLALGSLGLLKRNRMMSNIFTAVYSIGGIMDDGKESASFYGTHFAANVVVNWASEAVLGPLNIAFLPLSWISDVLTVKNIIQNQPAIDQYTAFDGARKVARDVSIPRSEMEAEATTRMIPVSQDRLTASQLAHAAVQAGRRDTQVALHREQYAKISEQATRERRDQHIDTAAARVAENTGDAALAKRYRDHLHTL